MQREEALTHGRILRFYVPLALSWLFMAVESPICITVISRLRDAEINTAAFLIMMGLSLFIESPVIDLLSTSTTLTKSRQDFATISKFVWLLIIGVTAVHTLVSLTPLYWFVTLTMMRVPQEVAEAARLGMAIMIPWSAFIGWRRYLQGILIRYHRTKLVGMGTAVRVGAVVITSATLLATTNWNGLTIAAAALVMSVGAEAMFAHLASRRVIAENFVADYSLPELAEQHQSISPDAADALGGIDPETPSNCPRPVPNGGSLTLGKLLKFHTPLTLTTMVTLIGGPVVSAFLALAVNPVLTLAAWQVAASFIWLFRTVVFALPEAVITLYRDENARILRNFCLYVGCLCSGLILILGLTRLDIAFFSGAYGHTAQTSAVAHVAFLASAPLPLINAAQCYMRGVLTAHHQNVARFTAVLVAMATLVGALAIAHFSPWRGVLGACIAFNVALVAELGVLVAAWMHRPEHGSLWPAKRSVFPS